MKKVHIINAIIMCLFFKTVWKSKKRIAQIENEKNRFKNQFRSEERRVGKECH